MIGLDIIVAGLLILLSGVFKGYMDSISEEKLAYRGKWWSKREGSLFKYKDEDPLKGPKFVGSTTIFVWTTDGWHLFQMLFLSCLDLALCLVSFDSYKVAIFFVLAKLLRGWSFEGTRKYIHSEQL